MDSVCVIIGNVIPDKAMQMSITEDDYVVEELAATASDPPFSNSILPWT
jgi:hypothetical protein